MVSTHVVETGADDDGVVNDMIHDRVVVRPLSRWCRFLMRYCVRGTALVMSFRFFITSRRNERTPSLSLPNVVHPIRITCMRCTFFQVRSGIISRGVIVRRLMIIMPLSPRKIVNHTSGHAVNHTPRPISTIRSKTKQCNCASVDTTTSFFGRLSCTTLF